MFILLNWVKFYTKEIAKALKIFSIGALIILTIIILKFKPAYKVTLDGENVGYIENKDNLELKIKKFINCTTGAIAFKEQTKIPEYELKLISRNRNTQEQEIMLAIQNSTITTYKTYAVTIDGEVKAIVGTEGEAKNVVETVKADLIPEVEMNVGIVEQYTTMYNAQTKTEAITALNNVKVAKVTAYNEAKEAKRKAEEAKQPITVKSVTTVGKIAGINLSTPVKGMITSRFGSRSSIRSSAHTGLDIATSIGTPIKPIASGTVTFAGYKGSYGNLVIINHGNGIESYYAHCSTINCVVGQKVETATVISTVGSTGNSTGPHLHLEIRQNGTPLNPENYLY